MRENNNEYRIVHFQDQNLEVDLGTELFEEVLVLVETDGQEVEQVSDVHIVGEAEERMSKTNKQITRSVRLIKCISQKKTPS